jgi:hypothetical protein
MRDLCPSTPTLSVPSGRNRLGRLSRISTQNRASFIVRHRAVTDASRPDWRCHPLFTGRVLTLTVALRHVA